MLQFGKRMKSKLPDGDWFKFIERTGHFYIYYLFAETDSWMLRRDTGFGFPSSLYRYQNGLGANFRDRVAYDAANKHFFEMIRTESAKLQELAHQGEVNNAKADELLGQFRAGTLNEFSSQEFTKLHAFFTELLLYGCTIPYLILEASDYARALGLWNDKHEKTCKPFESLRAVSKYFECEETILKRYFEEAAQKLALSDPSLAEFLIPKEIMQALTCEKSVSESELSNRKTWCVFWSTDGGSIFEFWYDKAALEQYSFFNDAVAPDDTQLSGTIACKGIARGQAKIVNTKDDMRKFQKGDILISQSTNPLLMPAILLCSGIVTDEGGMASHASVISRELKKPCIVGTKFATKIFKDGDMVEVDAEKGIVRKI